MAPDRTGQIITFYSYKGGTGRSMALANAAWVLASNGKHVLVVDWDLEAPGLHRYFHPFLLDKELTGTPGVLDLMWDFAAAAMDPGGSKAPDWYEPYADVEEYAVSLRHQFPENGAIDILGAGVQDVAYATRVGSFDWGNFYTRLGGGVFLEAVKRSMKSVYDYVLIDSRTGLSDTAGICTVQLPDILVVGFTLNNQSIAGASAVANSVRDQRKDMPIFPVPMRVEDGETAKLEAGHDYARASFESLLDGWDETSRDRYWGDVEVRYRMLYAYEEILAAVGERPHSQSILAASERLISYLTHGEVVETVAMDEVERRRLLLQFERPPPIKTGADIYLSYHRSDRAWAQWVLTQLEDAGYSVLVDVRDFEPGSDFELSMRRAQESATATVVLLSPAYGTSE
ncbi:MAG: KGGVGR-motif variant AAA ATPase, partial [Pseudonocardiaceae bacterium]